jgi:aerobic carbon-monoxide dehydrogenase large subunit
VTALAGAEVAAPRSRPPVDDVHASVGPPIRYASGRGCFTADIEVPGAAAMVVVRAEVAHGILRSVDLDAVRRAPGVLGAFTAADIKADLGNVPVISPRISPSPAIVPYLQPVVATGRVRYVGEPVAVVVAADRYLAEDAAALAAVEIAALDAVVDSPVAADGEALFAPGNEIAQPEMGFGDIDAVFSSAEIVESATIRIGRHSGVPMETRGLVACPEPDGTLTVYGAAKVVHSNRLALAGMLGMPPEHIRMREVDIGGGFGIRGEFYPEDFLVVWAARTLACPVGWIEDRREHLLAANHSRDQVHLVSVAASADGELLGIRSEFFVDSGAYVRTVGLRVADLTLGEIPGPYRFRAYSGRAHCVVTNRTPTGTYRSPGRFEASFVRERMVDKIAARVGLSPEELRRRNLVRPSDMPYKPGILSAGKELTFSEGDYPELFETVVSRTAEAAGAESARLAGAEHLRVRHAAACFVEKSGLGPFEDTMVEVREDGSVEVWSGASFLGQGLDAALARVVAEVLEVPMESVRAMRVDTDKIASGIGTYASRSMVMAGNAVRSACELVLEKARDAAAEHFEIDPADLEFAAGQFVARGAPAVQVTLGELAGVLAEADPAGGRLSASYRYEKESVTYGFGCHGAVVATDVRTGAVQVLRLVLGYDAGRVMDVDVVVGQLEGAAVQALGGALLERFSYDEFGNPVATTFMDYMLPTASEAPAFEVVLAASIPHDNPLGVRGAGEAGIPAVAAALASAIESSVGSPPVLLETPITPARVFDLVSRANGAGRGQEAAASGRADSGSPELPSS